MSSGALVLGSAAEASCNLERHVLHLQIENYLLRNHETRKYLQEQAYRLQQGIVSSTTQQVRGPMLAAPTLLHLSRPGRL